MRRERDARGWSRRELAEASGVSEAMVKAIERRRRRATLDAALALARALGKTVEALASE